MDLSLNPAQAAALELAEDAAHELLAPDAVVLDQSDRFPTETLQALGRRGLLGVNIPKQYGGLEAGPVAYALAVRALAAACPGTTVAMMVTNMVAEAIMAFGDDAQRQAYLPRICGGEWPAAGFSLSEPGAGSDAAALRTVAVRDGDDYILNGTKSWVTSGGHAGVYLVMAATDPGVRHRGISAFLVETGTPGFSAGRPEEKMGQHASTTTELVLEDCRVPASCRLGPEGIGFTIAMKSLDGGRVGVSAQACGMATAALAAMARFIEAGGEGLNTPALAEAQTLLGRAATELQASWLLCLRAASMKEAGKAFSREAAMAKVYCTETGTRVCQRAIEVHGLAGYTDAFDVERHLRNVRVTRIYEGTSEVQRIVIAREVLKGLA